MAVAGRGAVRVHAQAECLYRLVGLVAEVFSAAARAVREHPVEDEDAVRIGLSVDFAGSLDQGLQGSGFPPGSSRSDPQGERDPCAWLVGVLIWRRRPGGHPILSRRSLSVATTARFCCGPPARFSPIRRAGSIGSKSGRPRMEVACWRRVGEATGSGE